MNYEIIDLEQGSPQWIEFRRGKIGGSDIPTIMGCIDSYQKRSELLADKILNTTKEHSDFTKMLFADGHEIEKISREAFNIKTGRVFSPKVVAKKMNPRFIASLDGITDELDLIIEIKSTRKKSHLDDVKNKIVPRIYDLQIQWQLYLTDTKHAYLIVVDSITREAYTLLVERNEKTIEHIVSEAIVFLNDMDTTIVEAPKTVIVENVTMQAISEARIAVKKLQNQLDIYDELIKSHASKLLKEYGATRIEGFGVVIQEIERAGAIDYSKIEVLKGIDLEKFRKKSSRYIKISSNKND